MLSSTVITLNVYGFGTIKIDYMIDQFLLTVVGIGTGLLVNLYMPSLDKNLTAIRKELEKDFQAILKEIALYIKEDNMDWDGKEITNVTKTIENDDELV